MLTGIDVYEGDGAIEWHKVAETNHFAFVRGAYGDRIDKSGAPNAAAARSVELKVGIFHFWRVDIPFNKQMDAITKALEQAHVGPGDLPPVIDVEDNPKYDGEWDESNNSRYLDDIEKWLDKIKSVIGRPPIVYTRSGFWKNLGDTARFTEFPLWVASYRKDAPVVPKPWKDYAFWQYSDSGASPGVHGAADLNFFQGDFAALSKLCI